MKLHYEEEAGPLPQLVIEPACAVVGYGSGIYNSAKYYQQNGTSQGQYRQDLSGALRSSSASASAAASGDLLLRALTIGCNHSWPHQFVALTHSLA